MSSPLCIVSNKPYKKRSVSVLRAVFAFFALSCLAMLCSSAEEAVNPLEVKARIRYAEMKEKFTFRLQEKGTLESGDTLYSLAPGAYTLTLEKGRGATQHYHVFTRTFAPAEVQEKEACLREWQEKKFTPQVITFGLLYRLPSGRTLDNRRHWVSVARCKEKSEAKALADRLKTGSVAPWIRPERIAPGTASFSLQGPRGKASSLFAAPLFLDCEGVVEIVDVSGTFWKEKKRNCLYAPPLEIGIGAEDTIEIFGTLPVEEYLRGVVPAEMPVQWPLEALKAQALVARSEIYASLAGKYKLQGFDFTTLESCRAYWGAGEFHPSSDRAIRETAGEALSFDNRFAVAVFSSCCGGWTENNDTVWSGPPDRLLRGGSDLRENGGSVTPAKNMLQWLQSAPRAWCEGDQQSFRWQRRFSTDELSALINKKYKVGTVLSVTEGVRGVSGRLKSVTIVGTLSTVTIERELAIRQAFGGLPSAMIIIKADPPGKTPAHWKVYGGGRGHGVGLCQHGARGMAAAGLDYRDIVAHYFSGAVIERTR
ncbi:MAG TPA: SpoIID/LytB domain-containing protein [Candidatus Hydrogenedentes bacterium]|nr:SpoIID/LytB domain-containing protein [Candidatus Hydrogenedentota bacterium]HOD95226.1 SpoIID/LytB domain-containing protein [Candidatus Hydrogenedentota bacterium]HOR50654.1 SpoIID/LytB domain-containing protein [Candidatus Hydrogenedentota bacterium]HPK24564.1 SpoIID/LytB domain-containing protein [Candidatus Hydrogenedentota bacterium]